MGGILVIQSHERPRAELLNVSALEIPTLPTHGFPSQGCKRLLGGDASSVQCCFLVRTNGVVGVLWKGSYRRNWKYWTDCPFKSIGFISPVLGLSNRNQCMIVMLFLNTSLVFCWPIRVHSPNTLLHFPHFYLPLFHFLCFHQLLHIWRVPYDVSPFTPDAACQCLCCKMLQFGENPPRLCCLHSIKPSMAQMSRFSIVWKEHQQIFFSLKREITW